MHVGFCESTHARREVYISTMHEQFDARAVGMTKKHAHADSNKMHLGDS